MNRIESDRIDPSEYADNNFPYRTNDLKCPIVLDDHHTQECEPMIRRFKNIEYTELNSHCGRYLHLAFMCFVLSNSNRR